MVDPHRRVVRACPLLFNSGAKADIPGSRASKIFPDAQLNCATVRNVNLEARWNLLAAHASLRRRPVEWRKSVTKAVLKPFLVMISAAALLWCAAMAIHLAKAEALTGIG